MINSILSKGIIFAVGAAIGSAVTWRILKTKYARMAEEEINTMREYFRKKKNAEPEDTSEEEIRPIDESDVIEYVETIEEYEYTSDPVGFNAVPHIIEPDEFGECDDEYDLMYLTYYADGVLTDDMNVLVEDVDGTIGKGTLDYFNDPNRSSLYVRDDKNKVDYEILRTTENYADI